MRKHTVLKWAFVAILSGLISLVVIHSTIGRNTGGSNAKVSSSGDLALQIVSSLQRIARKGPIEIPALRDFASAKGEYESFQVVIQAPKRDLTNVQVSVSDLRDLQGHRLDQTNLTLYREHYVEVRHASPHWRGMVNRSLGTGWYADGLIPFVNSSTQQVAIAEEFRGFPFNLKANHNQPIWVDIVVPHNTPSGEYKGQITVTSDQGDVREDVQLKVWDFELPQTPSLRSSFAFWTTDSQIAVEELLKHRLMSRHIQPKDQPALTKQGLSSVDLGFWSGANNKTCKMRPAPSVEELQAEVARYQPGLLLYNKTADEIDDCPGLYDFMKAWGRNLHSAKVANLVTMTPTLDLYDEADDRSAVDIWVVLPIMYDTAPDRIAQARQRGEQIWSYAALVQDEYSPKWEIDFAPINFRIQPGFINQSLGLTGLLYWRVDLWTDDPWHNVQTYTQKNGRHYPGEGMLVYPGGPVGVEGVVPSMRLKWLRDGVEDYEYVEILKKLGRGDWALEVSQSIGRDWQTWTREPSILEAARLKMGAEIERLTRM